MYNIIINLKDRSDTNFTDSLVAELSSLRSSAWCNYPGFAGEDNPDDDD